VSMQHEARIMRIGNWTRVSDADTLKERLSHGFRVRESYKEGLLEQLKQLNGEDGGENAGEVRHLTLLDSDALDMLAAAEGEPTSVQLPLE